MSKSSRVLALTALPVLLVAVAPSAAWGSAMVEKVPVSLSVADDCNGGVITGHGSLELRQVNTGNGTFIFQYTAHFTGVGSLGDEYVGMMRILSFDGPGYSYREELLSKGSAPNEAYVLTVGRDQDGTPYSVLEVTCHG